MKPKGTCAHLSPFKQALTSGKVMRNRSACHWKFSGEQHAFGLEHGFSLSRAMACTSALVTGE